MCETTPAVLSLESYFRFITDDPDANPEIGTYYRTQNLKLLNASLPDLQIVLPVHPDYALATLEAVVQHFLEEAGGLPPDLPTTLRLAYCHTLVRTDANGNTHRRISRRKRMVIGLRWVWLRREKLLRVILPDPYVRIDSSRRFDPKTSEFPFDQQYFHLDVR